MPVLPTEMLAEVFPGITMLGGRLAPSSEREYVRDVQHYLAYCVWDAARARDPQTLRAWREHMARQGTFAACTINRRLAAVKTLVKISAALDALDAGLAYRFQLVERVRPSTFEAKRTRALPPVRMARDELRALWRLPDPTTLRGVRDRALLAALASTGCRISEIVAVTREQLVPRRDPETGEPCWQLDVWGKGQATTRRVPLSAEAYVWMQRWLSARAAYGVSPLAIFTVFLRDGTTPTAAVLSKHAGWLVVKRYARLAGMPNVKPHDFRRFVATELAKRDILLAQRVLGHARLETTRRYILDEDTPFGKNADVFH